MDVFGYVLVTGSVCNGNLYVGPPHFVAKRNPGKHRWVAKAHSGRSLRVKTAFLLLGDRSRCVKERFKALVGKECFHSLVRGY